GVRMLKNEAVWRRRIEGCTLAFRDRSNEVRAVARSRRVGALAADPIDRVVLEVVSACPGTPVRIGRGTPVLEPPLARGGDCAVNATRSGGGRGYNTTVHRVEAVGHLHHHRHVPVSASFVGDVFVAGNEPFARSNGPVRLDVRPVKRAVAAAWRGVD